MCKNGNWQIEKHQLYQDYSELQHNFSIRFQTSKLSRFVFLYYFTAPYCNQISHLNFRPTTPLSFILVFRYSSYEIYTVFPWQIAVLPPLSWDLVSPVKVYPSFRKANQSTQVSSRFNHPHPCLTPFAAHFFVIAREILFRNPTLPKIPWLRLRSVFFNLHPTHLHHFSCLTPFVEHFIPIPQHLMLFYVSSPKYVFDLELASQNPQILQNLIFTKMTPKNFMKNFCKSVKKVSNLKSCFEKVDFHFTLETASQINRKISQLRRKTQKSQIHKIS